MRPAPARRSTSLSTIDGTHSHRPADKFHQEQADTAGGREPNALPWSLGGEIIVEPPYCHKPKRRAFAVQEQLCGF
jgi:hypothetical protein